MIHTMGHAHHDPIGVAASISIAVFGAWVALASLNRLAQPGVWVSAFWPAVPASVLGLSIWSMHFLGMVSLTVPGVKLGFEMGLTALSLLLAMVGTSVAFVTVARIGGPVRGWRLPVAGTAMGLAIAAMHYTGMVAITGPIRQTHSYPFVVAAVGIAIAASTVSLRIGFGPTSSSTRIVSSVLLGIAIAGLHYVAMAGTDFVPLAHLSAEELLLPPQSDIIAIALGVGAGCAVILMVGIAIIGPGNVFGPAVGGATERLVTTLMLTGGKTKEILDGLPAGVILLEPGAHSVMFANAEALRVLGTAGSARLARVAAGNLSNQDVLCPTSRLVWGAGGGMRRLLVTVSRTADSSGGLLVVAFRDMTALAAAEEAIKRGEAAAVVGQRLGEASHDFNNILMVIANAVDALVDPEATPEVKRGAELAIRRATDRGISFARSILTVLRSGRRDSKKVDAKKPTARVESFDLAGWLKGPGGEVIRNAAGKGLHVSVYVEDDLLPVLVDPEQLELSVINLVVNARDALAGSGAIVVSLEPRRIDQSEDPDGLGGMYVALSVADTGPGIRPLDRPDCHGR